MLEKNNKKDLEIQILLKRKLRKINKRQSRLTKRDLGSLLGIDTSNQIYPEQDPVSYKANDY